MTRRMSKWEVIGAFTLAACLGGVAAGRAQFTSFNDRSRAMLEGNWQSCREADGQYGERVYDGRWPGFGPFELHMGPYHEFALYRGIQNEHRDHQSSENLLKPYKLDVVGNQARHRWDAAGLRLDVSLAGGSREECESWFVSLKRSDPGSSH
jgi:hypothetical protein